MTSFGPFDGSTHDCAAAQIIDLHGLVRRNYTFPGSICLNFYFISTLKGVDATFCLFGDSGYGITSSIITPFRRGPGQTEDEAEWNQ